jgi:transcription-repair coupling factor (superfamily II helicase)
MLKLGDKLELEAERRRLDAAGYRHVPQVMEPGDYATRGALLDLYPAGAPEPYRIELFDERIDSIRSFDPETQRSLAKVPEIRLLSAREFPLDERSIKAFRERLRERFPIDPRHCPVYQDLREGSTPSGIEYYLPLFFERCDTLFDYLAPNALPVLAEGALPAAEAFWHNTRERFEQRRHDLERPVLTPEDLYLAPQELRERLNQEPRVEVHEADPGIELHDLGSAPAPMLALTAKGEAPGQGLRDFLADGAYRVLIAADSPGRRESLAEHLQTLGFAPQTVSGWDAFVRSDTGLALTVAPIDDGFALPGSGLALLTERQLFPERAPQTRRRRRAGRDPDTIVRDLAELAEGAPVVHEDHGVGRYRGLISLDLTGTPGEFLALEYAKGDKLYVPVAQLHLVSRYTAARPSSRRCTRSAATPGTAPRRRRPSRCATWRPSCSSSMRSATPARAARCRSTACCTSSSAPASRSRRRPTRPPRSRP